MSSPPSSQDDKYPSPVVRDASFVAASATYMHRCAICDVVFGIITTDHTTPECTKLRLRPGEFTRPNVPGYGKVQPRITPKQIQESLHPDTEGVYNRRPLYFRTPRTACYKCFSPLTPHIHPWPKGSAGCNLITSSIAVVVDLMVTFRPLELVPFLPSTAPCPKTATNAFWRWSQNAADDGTPGWANFALAFEASAKALAVMRPTAPLPAISNTIPLASSTSSSTSSSHSNSSSASASASTSSGSFSSSRKSTAPHRSR